MIETILTVSKYDLERLNPDEAVATFSELLWAEADTIGIQKSLIDIPSAITVADGGVDAEVRHTKVQGGQGIIQQGLTRYQIKTGDFKLSDDNKIKEILFSENEKQLKPRIKSCLDNNGTLVVVLFGWDNPENEDGNIIKKFRQHLSKVGNQYKTANLRIFKQNNLISFFKPFPSLALRVNRRAQSRFKTHFAWSRFADMNTVFEVGGAQRKRIGDICEELRRYDTAINLHVEGDAGIGKTRIVLEATKKHDLAPLVIYNESARAFRDSDLITELVKEDNNFYAIVVVDECDADSRSYIWNHLKSRSPKIKLVTICNEELYFSGVSLFDVPALGDTQVSKIIQSYDIPEDQSKRWVDLCSGSPRVAHVIGQNLRSNPEDLLKPPAEVNIWERYIVGSDDTASEKVHQRRHVLRYVSLFKRFGYCTAVLDEAKFIAQKMQEIDPEITWVRFQEIVSELKSKKTLQGENTLYITPKALHIWLWREWWDKHGLGFDVEGHIRSMPPKLREWFAEMFIYARDSNTATQVVKELLGPDGPFQKSQFLKDELGSRFFLSLATAHPEMALNCLERTIGTWDVEKILEFSIGRRNIVWALERMVMWKELFPRAGRLLLTLGEGETESYSNNASGVFAGLYSPGYGKVAPTEAPPEERFPLLKEALESNSKKKKLLALEACDSALESQYFSRSVGPEIQGLREEPKLWKPKTYRELWDAYRRVWILLEDNLPKLEQDEKVKAVDIFMQNSRGLVRIQNLADMILNTLIRLGREAEFRNPIIDIVNQILLYDENRLPEPTIMRLRKLIDDLTGKDFESLLRYYVGMNPSQERLYQKKGKVVGPTSIQELATLATSDTKLIVNELEWLTTHEAQNSYAFGYELAKANPDLSLLPQILDVQKKGGENVGSAFLGGYFRGIHEKDRTAWEKQLLTLQEDESLSKIIPGLIWRSEGLNDRTASLILELYTKNIISVSGFGVFSYSPAIRGLSEEVFAQWLKHLLINQDKKAPSMILNLVHTYYIDKDRERILPEKLTYEVLTNYSLFKGFSNEYRNQTMSEYHWAEITENYLEKYPERSLDLADIMLEFFGVPGTIFDSHDYKVQEILNQIAASNPNEVWHIIARHLSKNSSSAFHITQWLRGDGILYLAKDGVLGKFPKEKIFEWVDEDIEVRAWRLASFVPKKLTQAEGETCWVNEILQRYGQREDVRRNLSANFSTEGWTGPASLHHQQKKEKLLEFRKKETNQKVRMWIDECVAALDEDIERAQISEERGGY